jgi:hypothetical protein
MPDDFEWLNTMNSTPSPDQADELERQFLPAERSMTRREYIASMRTVKKKEHARETLAGSLPEVGESAHFISNANFDYWNVIAEAVLILGKEKPVFEFYGSTWTMNRQNVLDLMELLDNGVILKCAMLTGTYFKRRESSVYAQLLSGLLQRQQRFVAFNNHTKIALFTDSHSFIVMEGSANWTANPRLEQFTITNHPGLYAFHREWMEQMLAHPPKDTLNNESSK